MRALVRKHAVLRIGGRGLQKHNEGRRRGGIGVAADVEDDAGITEGDEELRGQVTRKSRVFELRYFGGMSIDEAASNLQKLISETRW